MNNNENQSAIVTILVAVIIAIIGPITVWYFTRSNQGSQSDPFQATITILQTQVANQAEIATPTNYYEPTSVQENTASIVTNPSTEIPIAPPIPPTKIPTATPIPTTVPGTLLRDGETWYIDGWSLTVSNFTYQTLDQVLLVIHNRTQQNMILPSSLSKVIVTSDQGDKIECGYIKLYEDQIEIKSNSKLERPYDCGSYNTIFSQYKNSYFNCRKHC